VTYSDRGHLRRIEGRTLSDNLAAIKRYWDAVADRYDQSKSRIRHRCIGPER